MKHTKEPWAIDQYGHIYGPYTPMSDAQKKDAGVPVGIGAKRQPHIAAVHGKDAMAGDGNRIVTCVNACAGIPNPAAIPDVVDALREITEECPQGVDPATVPQAGIEAAPQQVVINMSVGLLRLRKARAALAKLEGGEG